jgi:hypothetical protein
MTGSSPFTGHSPYLRRYTQLSPDQLASIDEFLQQQLTNDSDALHKTHFFHGRYENIYINRNSHPDLQELISEAVNVAASILDLNPDELSIGFWFNYMPPGHITTLHTHDDIDELLSGVIYITVPEQSGNLVLKTKDEEIELKPVQGNYVFFDPDTPHAVNKNCSQHSRLSIGMNFGLSKNKADCFAAF